MSDTMDPLQRWQRDTEVKLNSEAYCVDIPVFVVRPREKQTATVIDTLVNQALSGMKKKNGKAGVAVQILMPLVDVPDEDPSGPRCDALMTLRVQELPMVNEGADGTHKPVEEVALTMMNILHKYGMGNGLSQQGFAKDAYTPSLEFDPKLTIDLKIKARFGLAGPGRVQTPVIAGNADLVQISCNTPGAVIYYTTNYSFPGLPAANPESIPYGFVLQTEDGLIITTEEGNPLSPALPFTVPEGTLVRAAAYKPDQLQGSDVARMQF